MLTEPWMPCFSGSHIFCDSELEMTNRFSMRQKTNVRWGNLHLLLLEFHLLYLHVAQELAPAAALSQALPLGTGGGHFLRSVQQRGVGAAAQSDWGRGG